MSGRKAGLWAAAAITAVFAAIVILVAGIGGSRSQAGTGTGYIVGQGQLNTAAVPPWALQPLLAAAGTCPEVTGPILAAQLDTESGWNRDAYNAGSGATGLAQFIPATWAIYRTDGDGDGHADPRDPADAIATQAVYMCDLIDFVKATPGLRGELVDLALAGYNAGPGNVQRHRGIPPFPETIAYVTKIRQLANTTYSMHPAAGAGSAAAVISKAVEHVGKTMYAWGGGTLDGPSPGTAPDLGVIGFDCSSLVRYAYYQGTGQAITLPRTSREQYAATKAQPVALDALQPGDLMFWGRGSIHHVALFIGNGRMIEAPESGQQVRETAIANRTGGDYAGATRVFGGPLDTATATARS